MYNEHIGPYVTQNMHHPPRYDIVTEWSYQMTREQSAWKLFRREHTEEHCPFKLYTSQNCSVEFGYSDNLRSGIVVLDDTLCDSSVTLQ